MWSQTVPINVYNAISELHLSQTELFRDLADPGAFTFSGQLSEAITWSLWIADAEGSTVYSASGEEGPFQATWDGKVGGTYVDGVYQATFTADGASISQALLISRATAGVLITGDLENEPEWVRVPVTGEITAVADACRARGIPYTLFSNPRWYDRYEPRPPRLGMDYLLKQPYRYRFHADHGGFGTKRYLTDERQIARVIFYDVYVIGDNYWMPNAKRNAYPAFSDLEVYPGKYHIVMINTCWSAGSLWHGIIDPSIAGAFQIWENEPELDRTYLGWTAKYMSSPPYLGTAWTKEFWHQLSIGHMVSQAAYWSDIIDDGWMHNSLWMQGGPYVTYLTW